MLCRCRRRGRCRCRGGCGVGDRRESGFKLRLALRDYDAAARTSVLVAKQEQEMGNYKIAHAQLFETHKELELQPIRVPQALRKAPAAGTPALRQAGRALARAAAFAALGESSSSAWRWKSA